MEKTTEVASFFGSLDFYWYVVMIVGFFIVIYLDSKAYAENQKKDKKD